MEKFRCKNKRETWIGHIRYMKNHGSHYEMYIESRSSILIIFGKKSSGNFLCVPDFNVGCELVELRDRFWNKERITSILGEVDGTTVEEALYTIRNRI